MRFQQKGSSVDAYLSVAGGGDRADVSLWSYVAVTVLLSPIISSFILEAP